MGAPRGAESSDVPKHRERAVVAPCVYLPVALLQTFCSVGGGALFACTSDRSLQSWGRGVRASVSLRQPEHSLGRCTEVAGSCPGT